MLSRELPQLQVANSLPGSMQPPTPLPPLSHDSHPIKISPSAILSLPELVSSSSAVNTTIKDVALSEAGLDASGRCLVDCYSPSTNTADTRPHTPGFRFGEEPADPFHDLDPSRAYDLVISEVRRLAILRQRYVNDLAAVEASLRNLLGQLIELRSAGPKLQSQLSGDTSDARHFNNMGSESMDPSPRDCGLYGRSMSHQPEGLRQLSGATSTPRDLSQSFVAAADGRNSMPEPLLLSPRVSEPRASSSARAIAIGVDSPRHAHDIRSTESDEKEVAYKLPERKSRLLDDRSSVNSLEDFQDTNVNASQDYADHSKLGKSLTSDKEMIHNSKDDAVRATQEEIPRSDLGNVNEVDVYCHTVARASCSENRRTPPPPASIVEEAREERQIGSKLSDRINELDGPFNPAASPVEINSRATARMDSASSSFRKAFMSSELVNDTTRTKRDAYIEDALWAHLTEIGNEQYVRRSGDSTDTTCQDGSPSNSTSSSSSPTAARQGALPLPEATRFGAPMQGQVAPAVHDPPNASQKNADLNQASTNFLLDTISEVLRQAENPSGPDKKHPAPLQAGEGLPAGGLSVRAKECRACQQRYEQDHLIKSQGTGTFQLPQATMHPAGVRNSAARAATWQHLRADQARPGQRASTFPATSRVLSEPVFCDQTQGATGDRHRSYNSVRLHDEGRCKPCAFYYDKKKGCSNGDLCDFCHHEDHSRLSLKQWKKRRQRSARAAELSNLINPSLHEGWLEQLLLAAASQIEGGGNLTHAPTHSPHTVLSSSSNR